MALIALVARTWVNLMIHNTIDPRCLADDLMFVAEGSTHRYRSIVAMDLSRKFFHDMGAKVATNKCFMFTSCKDIRGFLRNYTWQGQGLDIPVTGSFRDLGSHLNLTNTKSGQSLVERLRKAIKATRPFKYLPITQQQKEVIIRCNILPAVFYGSEVAHTNHVLLERLRSTIADIVGPNSARRSVDLTPAFTASVKDLDPQAHIVYNSISAIRRLMAKYPESREMVKYAIFLHNGTGHREIEFSGPVNVLMHNLERCGATVGPDLIIRHKDEAPFDLWNAPWQHLKNATFAFVARARTRRVHTHRTFHGQVTEIDNAIISSIINKLETHEADVWRYVAAGAYWEETNKCAIDSSDGDCPVIKNLRKANALSGLDIQILPQCIKVGLPPAMGAKFTQLFWSDHMCTGHNANYEDGKMVGIPKGSVEFDRASSDNRTMNVVLHQCDIQHDQQCARQVFAALKGNANQPIMPIPVRCTLPAPDAINVYTDGSWQFPLRQYFALGGAGVWWPSR